MDASSGLIGGGSNNLAFNSNFNLASSGVTLPGPGTGASVANGANPATALNFSNLASGGSSALASTSALLAQGSLNAQFRIFAVNSQGPDYQLSQPSQLNFLTQAYGFGSGTQPNAPWMPNAYNLGLANRQFNYSSQSDFGFQPVAPWTVPVAHAQPKDQPTDQSEDADITSEQALVQKSTHEQEQTQKRWMDEDTGDRFEDWKALLEKSASDKEHLVDQTSKQESDIPDAVWLSALAPTPMAALIAGLPGMTIAAESCDADAAECGDGGADAPE